MVKDWRKVTPSLSRGLCSSPSRGHPLFRRHRCLDKLDMTGGLSPVSPPRGSLCMGVDTSSVNSLLLTGGIDPSTSSG